MNRCSWLLFFLVLGLAAAPVHAQKKEKSQPAPTAPATTPAGKGFDAFQMVRLKNIFDPNRKPMRVDSSSESKSAKDRNRPSYFTLTGTMVAEGRSLAFFSGSRSEFSKVLPVGEMVGGYKVVSITSAQTELEHDGKSVVMTVGMSQQIDGSTDEGPGPAPAGPDGSAAAATPPASGAPPSDSNSSAPAASAPTLPATTDKAEILRRLMERARAERQ